MKTELKDEFDEMAYSAVHFHLDDVMELIHKTI
jgi:hypothetical protein